MKKMMVLLLLIASSAFGGTIDISPIAPTTATPVTVRVTTPEAICPTSIDTRIEGSKITITLVAASVCLPIVPGPSTHTVQVGVLPAGVFIIDAQVRHGNAIQLLDSKVVVVRDAQPPFTIEPGFVFRGGGPLRISRASGVAGVTSVTIGGETMPFTLNAGGGSLSVNAPVRNGGLVDVVLRFANGTAETARLFYSDGPPPESVVEPVLFPVLSTVRGAFGSEFISEASIYNGGQSTVLPFNIVFPQLLCSPTPWCDQAFSPGAYRAFRGENHPHGALMYVSRDQAANMTYSLRVRDTSRGTTDYGAEIRVVRERDLKTATFPLLDVPVVDAFRTRVRVYAIDELENATATLSFFRPNSNTPLATRIVSLEPGGCDDDSCVPAYAEVDLQAIAELQGNDRVVVQVTVPHARSWAFATVTNNATQVITTVTPN